MQSDRINMQTDQTESHSIGHSDSANRHSQNHPIARFAVPSTLGEATNNFACGEMASRVAILANSDEFSSIPQGKNTRDFSSCLQTSSILCNDHRLMEGVAIPNSPTNAFPADRYSSFENQQRLTTPCHFAYPFEYAKNGIAPTSSDVVSSSFETLLHNYEASSPFDTNAKWDLSKFITGGGCLPNEWAMIEQSSLNSNGLVSSRFRNELSLSLATSQPSILLEQCSEMGSSAVTSYSLNSRGTVSEHTSRSCKNPSSNLDSHEPMQLPTLLLSGSRFARAMQEILAEIACYVFENVEDGANVSFSSSCIDGRGNTAVDFSYPFVSRNELLEDRDVEAKKKHLLALLQLVDDRYNQCLDEIHTVTSAFHAVTELDTSLNLHARFAQPTISLMYKNLRERISSHILAIGAAHLDERETRDDDKSLETCSIPKQWALQQLSKRENQIWRPQRGLPEKSVAVLRAWMFQNFLHPYPKDAEKHLLALKSGLTRNQVSNWFINARVRLWKPMIEEMCAEMKGRKARRNDEETEGHGFGHRRNHVRFDMRRFTMD